MAGDMELSESVKPVEPRFYPTRLPTQYRKVSLLLSDRQEAVAEPNGAQGGCTADFCNVSLYARSIRNSAAWGVPTASLQVTTRRTSASTPRCNVNLPVMAKTPCQGKVGMAVHDCFLETKPLIQIADS